MLQELSIQNFAIIPKLALSFQNGMTVLTGETGAGKSIIIDAVGLLTGGRGSVDFIREGTDKAVLQGLLDVDKDSPVWDLLEQYGIELDGQQILIHRELQRNGRNVIRMNGTLINATILKEIGAHLVDIHGQNEHQELMNVERHIYLLDEFGKHEIEPILHDYRAAYHKYRDLALTFKKRQEDEHAWAQRLDMLTFQSQELSAANLQVGEEESLNTEYQELTNYQDVLTALSTAFEALQGDWEGNGLEVVGKAMNAMEEVEELSPRYQALSERVRGAFYELQDAASGILDLRDNLEFDPARLQEVEDRLNLIQNLERKYGENIPAILAHQEKVDQELAQMGGAEQSAETLKADLDVARTDALEMAKQLTADREKCAKDLISKIHEQLADLYMGKAVFDIHFAQSKHLTEMGMDDIEFYVQTNPGESSKPLVKIASGGELSRMMLAMKTIFAREQGVTSIIFDEVDTGVSGRVAQAIAEKIETIGQRSQVLTITHLPQVAAVADHHFYIEKQVDGERTITTVRPLADEERIDELARMLSGDELTQAARENAQDLLQRAHQRK